MSILLSDEELEALDGLPHLHRCLYIFGIRRYMDYSTGITGIKRKISYKSLSEEIYVEIRRGVKEISTKSRDQIKRMLIVLEKAGLVKRQSIITKDEKQLILECLLAQTDKSIQIKAAPWPPHSLAHKAAPEKDNNENRENPYKNRDDNYAAHTPAEDKSRPESRPTQNEKAATHPLSDRLDKIGYDLRQVFFDLLSQRKFPLAYLTDPRTNAMLEAWLFGNVTPEEAGQAMQHADASAAGRQQRVSRPWYYQDIPFQFRAQAESAKAQTQEIKHETNRPRTHTATTNAPRSRPSSASERMAAWVKEQERLEALEEESESE